jgi:hypothetical protein
LIKLGIPTFNLSEENEYAGEKGVIPAPIMSCWEEAGRAKIPRNKSSDKSLKVLRDGIAVRLQNYKKKLCIERFIFISLDCCTLLN